MRAGIFRHSIQIQQITEASDGQGGKTHSPVKVYENRAAIDTVDGTEKFNAARKDPRVTHLVTIRYRPGITPKHRVFWPLQNRWFDIKFIVNVKERNRTLILNCEEIVR